MDNSKWIIDSTRPNFVSSYQNPRESKDKENKGPIDHKPNNRILESNLKASKKPTRSEEAEAADLVKSMLKKRAIRFQPKHMLKPHLLFYIYNAQDKKNIYDKTPMALSLGVTNDIMLGLNLHWCPVKLRIAFIKTIKDMNILNLNYHHLKPLLLRLKLQPIIRRYIIPRMSSKGVVVPPELWLTAVKIRSETFTNGQSSVVLYRKALKGVI